MSTPRVPNHGHCIECGKAVPFGDKTCGLECDQVREATNRQRKRSMWMLYGLMAAGFLLLVVAPQFTGR